MLKIKIETGNAEVQTPASLATILEAGAESLRAQAEDEEARIVLRDVNGNTVGVLEFTPPEPEGDAAVYLVQAAYPEKREAYEADVVARTEEEAIKEGQRVIELRHGIGAHVYQVERKEHR